MQLIVNDLIVNYQLSGHGKLVLLLHGWGDRAKGLAELQQQLAVDYQVVALDLPGFGDSQAPKGVWSLDDYGLFVHDFLKKLKLEMPFAVIGHSNGGALAIRAVSLQQLKPQKLVLLAASGVRTGSSARRVAIQMVAKAGGFITKYMPRRHRSALRKRLYQTVGSDMLIVPQLQETFKKTVRQDVQQDAAKLELPTLLIYAENDQAVPLTDGQRYRHLIKNSQLLIVPEAGHFLHLERPKLVIARIQDFLK